MDDEYIESSSIIGVLLMSLIFLSIIGFIMYPIISDRYNDVVFCESVGQYLEESNGNYRLCCNIINYEKVCSYYSRGDIG